MDAKHINNILAAFTNIMPMLGMDDVQKKGMLLKGKDIHSLGIGVVISLVGDIKGNIIYTMTEDSAKKFASKMMMGMPVETLDDMSKSAVSEMINMLTGNVATNFSNDGVTIDISPPAFLQGEVLISTSTTQVLSLDMCINGIDIQVNISLED